jgi:hypothetical protein
MHHQNLHAPPIFPKILKMMQIMHKGHWNEGDGMYVVYTLLGSNKTNHLCASDMMMMMMTNFVPCTCLTVNNMICFFCVFYYLATCYHSTPHFHWIGKMFSKPLVQEVEGYVLQPH